MIWHSSSAEEVLAELNTDKDVGLTTDEAKERLGDFGKNLSVNEEEISKRAALMKQLKKPSVIILLCLLVIYVLRELATGRNSFLLPIVAFIIVLIKETLCILFEYHSRNMLAQLKNSIKVSANVIRNGEIVSVSGKNIVPGDILVLEAGDFIPADARIIEATGLRCDESVLFGEKGVIVVPKNGDAVLEDHALIKDRVNMLYCGCHVMTGSCLAVVVETGSNAEIRRSVIKEKVFFHKGIQEKIADRHRDFLKVFKGIAFGASAVIVILGTFVTKGDLGWGKFLESLIAAVAFYISIVPGSYPTRLACLLVLGIKRFEKDKAIIFNPQTIEKLAGVTVICSDKTGTLTQNRMSLQKVFDGEKVIDLSHDSITRQCEIAMRFGSLSCDTADSDNADHTETALISAATRYLNIVKSDFDAEFPRIASIPLTPERKIKTSVNMIEGKVFDIVRGAPDIILERCISVDYDSVKKAYEEMCSEGLRVLAISYKVLDEVPTAPTPEMLENDLQFLGLFGISDRERKGVASEIELCKNAGISTVMFTGDHINTAAAIAEKIGILDEETLAVTGEQLDELSDAELSTVAGKIRVCARISQDQRIRMVEALHSNEETVLLTADSAANFIPMDYADVGCAMGRTGTDVAKGNADLVVADDSFSSIVRAIRNARGIFGNFSKYVNYYISLCACVFITTAVDTCIFRTVFPSSPLILFGAVFALLFPIFAIGYETADKSIMKAAPKTVGEKMLDYKELIMSAIMGVAVSVVPILVSVLTLEDDGSKTVTFVALVFSLVYYMFISRSPELFYKRILHNRFMVIVSAIAIAVTIIIAATPLGLLFGLAEAKVTSWLIAILLPLAIPIVFETLKFFGITVNK